MTYEEKIEAMARAMHVEHLSQRAGMTAVWECHSERYRESIRKEARAAAEAIGLREMMEALEQSQKALAMMTEPEAIRSTSVSGAWAAAVAAECAARRALSPAP